MEKLTLSIRQNERLKIATIKKGLAKNNNFVEICRYEQKI